MTYSEASNSMDFTPRADLVPKDQYESHLANFPILCTDIVMINTKGQVLLLCRNEANSDWKGKWATVGGAVKRYEPLRRAAQRIVARETGQRHALSAFEFLGIQEFMTTVTHGISTIFKVYTDDEAVTLDNTSSECLWIEPENITTDLLMKEYRSILRLALRDE